MSFITLVILIEFEHNSWLGFLYGSFFLKFNENSNVAQSKAYSKH